MAQETESHTDDELVARALEGEVECFETIVERYQGRLVSFLTRMLGDRELAHDLVQETFIKVYDALDRFDPKYKFSTWIFRIAHNLGIDEIRKRRVTLLSLQRTDGYDETYEWDLPSDDPSPYRDVRNVERGKAIRAAVADLPWDYRELILLRHYAALSYQEIASVKDMPLGTVKNKLFRARQMLKGDLEAFLGD